MTRRVRAGAPMAAIVLALAVVVLGLAACGGSPTPASQAPVVAVATPMTSLTPDVAGTAAALRNWLATSGGYRLDALRRSYRPAEPAELVATPRAVFQVDVGDPDAGYVVVYSFATPEAAHDRGDIFARYLASGFGQTNYPLDAQFALSQVGSTLVFHWWSRERAEDPVRAIGAFDVISRFGLPIEVRK